jgi:hypothetical protein
LTTSSSDGHSSIRFLVGRLLADAEERFQLVQQRLVDLDLTRQEYIHHKEARGEGTKAYLSIPFTPLSLSRGDPDWRYRQMNQDIARCRYAIQTMPEAMARARRALEVDQEGSLRSALAGLVDSRRSLDRANIPSPGEQ